MSPLSRADEPSRPGRVLIFVPNWVGDVVMATPALRSVRAHFAGATLVHLLRPYVAEVLRGSDLADETISCPGGGWANQWRLVSELRERRFDLAILLTNSFRSAVVARLARIPRRVGYARDGRSWLLTDRLHAPRANGRWRPYPALDYYNDLARHVGCADVGDQLYLATTPADEAAVDARLGRCDADRPLVVLNPGANFGPAKCWPAEHFAAVADALAEEAGARVVASLAPAESAIAERLRAAAKHPIGIFVDPPLGLGPLKALVRRASLLVTNDTGPRHFAAAFGVPVVTVFGSSDPAWTDTRFALERSVHLQLECQPCMERVCPLGHHHCMKLLEPRAVIEQAMALLPARRGVSRVASR